MDTDGRQAEACTAAAALIVTFLVGAACRARSSKRPRPLPFQHDEVSGFDHLDGHAPRRGLRLVVVSDTHNFHHKLKLPDGDVLIHAGDFTQYGKEEHAHDFNQWLAEQPHRTKLVVLGNHENNSDWHKRAADVLSNATLLRQSAFDLQVPGSSPVRFFGTDFFWPCLGSNPYFDQIPAGTDVVIAHGPAKGCADGGRGCPALLKALHEGRHRKRPCCAEPSAGVGDLGARALCQRGCAALGQVSLNRPSECGKLRQWQS
ncbi:unnamed protein product [Effrenium voratum]|nr:unnamed protein product [Effrenium voratum]